MTLEFSDLDTLKDAAIKKFDDSVAQLAGDEPLDREVAQLQAELEQIYRMVVLLQKNETSMERVAEIWEKMVMICDEFARRLSALPAKQPACRASYDRILDLRNAAEERQRIHSRA
ncbi:hypothetical protein SBV1_1240017 [Verrucomicrobia bacterium]|nr:hypothetical protein SBV1_1240017 [Verrucomicrobiota bacterium]